MCAQKNTPSFNGLVFKKAYKRLALSPLERIVFQRLLGFLLRNNKPFPYTSTSMTEITGYKRRAVFMAFDTLEKKRLINRIGMGKNRRFCRGSILDKIISTVQFSSKVNLNNFSTTVQLVHPKLNNSAIGAPNKTSFFLKLKESDISIRDLQQLNFYAANNFPIPDEESHLKELIEEARRQKKS